MKKSAIQVAGIELPWPSRDLSPNSRVHWAVKSRAVRVYRRNCWAIALESGIRPKEKPVRMRLTFSPPSRRFDMDNAIAAFKGGADGLADAWGIDDRHFIVTYKWAEPVKGGRVVVELEE